MICQWCHIGEITSILTLRVTPTTSLYRDSFLAFNFKPPPTTNILCLFDSWWSHGESGRRLVREHQPPLLLRGVQLQPWDGLVQAQGRVQPAGDDPPPLHRGHLAPLGQDHALLDRAPLQLRGRLHCGRHLHVLHWLHHLHHQTGDQTSFVIMRPMSMFKVTISGENGEEEVIDVPIWNGTVANIVLMSLGRIVPVLLSY